MKRCEWVNLDNPLYVQYHDEEWGRPCYDEGHLFAMLCLEGQQAGLSWETILKKKAGYFDAFFDFDVKKIAKMSDQAIEDRLSDIKLVRNRLKLFAIRKNAQATLKLYKNGQRLSDFLWEFVDFKPIVNHWVSLNEIPAETDLSKEMSVALKRQGFTFVGPTICYAFMQAVGMVDDHLDSCFLKHRRNSNKQK